MTTPPQQKQSFGDRGEWVCALTGCAVYFGGIERGIEVPLDDLDTPHELWATIIHFSVEKTCREQLGWPCSPYEENADLGSLIMMIDDLCDLESIYRHGMSSDAWNGSLNAVTRWLCREIAKLPAEPSWRDYSILGARVRDHAELLDLNDVFGDGSLAGKARTNGSPNDGPGATARLSVPAPGGMPSKGSDYRPPART